MASECQPIEPPVEMKMCPFCGSLKASLRTGRVLSAVVCQCGAKGPARAIPAEAVTLWNERRF